MLLRNLKFLILVVVFLTFTNTPILAKIIHVPGDSSSIQSGINGASDGDTVLVARGHYYERINFYGKAILVTSNYIFDNETTTIASTIIDADTLVLGVADTGSVVVFVSGEDSTSIIQGFTLQNGIGTLHDNDERWGGGIYCSASSPTIKNNSITRNNYIESGYNSSVGGGISCYQSTSYITGNFINENYGYVGGGIYCGKSTLTITNNRIAGNRGDLGGGILCYMSSPRISNNTISGNSGEYGGGIHCQVSPSPIVDNNIITRNSATRRGGGIDFWWDCFGVIQNNIIANNSADNGGGIGCDESSPIITNNTITTNSASSCGGGISCSYQSFPTVANNIISNSINGEGICCDVSSSPKIYYNDIWNNYDDNFIRCPAGVGDTTWGTNINGIPSDSFYNIIRDPLFVVTLNDFHLQEGSPCIDAGDNSVSADSDLDGNTRIVDGNKDDSAVVDMGAFEYQPSVGIADGYVPLLVGDFTLAQNYPNPFNPETNIQYYIPEPTRVKLVIYNVLGQKVTVLVNEFQTAGRKYVTWDGKDQRGRMVASGMYLYKLETSDLFYSKQMLLLK